ncbi:MAG: BREX-1 system phosphatase PglZ type B, partial [Chloroflexi bacterium]|nr:BREX-1 system phosphatase PglZ type B [Chloroflexota bacterium]
EPVDRLRKEAPLRTAFFDALLHPDDVRNLLQWLNAPEAFRQANDANAWAAFRALCRSKYGFDPQTDGEITAARLLGERDGAWEVVWSRFREAPASYPTIPDLLRAARPTQVTLSLWHLADSWPQENEELEASLRAALLALADRTASEARAAIASLEEEHGPRRDWVWAELGQAPLARVLKHLTTLARATAQSVAGVSVDDIARRYADRGWAADLALLDALASVELPRDVAAVKAASGALYRPWLEAGASALQEAIANDVGRSFLPDPLGPADSGVCLLFCDGLRFDLACRLTQVLDRAGYDSSIRWRMAPLPTVTPTAKPVVSPAADMVGPGPGFDTVVRDRGTKVTAEALRKLVSEQGYQVLKGDDLGDPSGRGWTELGAVDSFGHEHGWKLAHHLGPEVRGLAARIGALLEHGWRQVVVVTDHGWLLLPGGLPKVALPEHLTETRKGRCARLKPLSTTDQQTVRWYWDPGVQIAVARGISCYEAGKEYEHGGISPQECVAPVITVGRREGAAQGVSIETIAWKGLRCVVTLEGGSADMTVDLRTRPRDPGTSLVTSPKSPRADGTVSLLVPDDSREGEAAMVAVISADGTILHQAPTVVGG